jgi:hypothetical protein
MTTHMKAGASSPSHAPQARPTIVLDRDSKGWKSPTSSGTLERPAKESVSPEVLASRLTKDSRGNGHLMQLGGKNVPPRGSVWTSIGRCFGMCTSAKFSLGRSRFFGTAPVHSFFCNLMRESIHTWPKAGLLWILGLRQKQRETEDRRKPLSRRCSGHE